jgi:hypothetical protein
MQMFSMRIIIRFTRLSLFVRLYFSLTRHLALDPSG